MRHETCPPTRRWTAAAACAGLALCGAALVLGAARVNGQPAPPAGCAPSYTKTVEPGAVLLGETVTVTLHAAPVCTPAEWLPMHVVLVLDASGSMAGARATARGDAFMELVRRLQLDASPARRVGVVQFSSSARTLCPLTNNTSHVRGCLGRVGAAGGSRIDLGIEEGMKVLRRGRADVTDREWPLEVMIVLADGANNAGCASVLQAAGEVKSQGVLLVALCLGPDCDTSCMLQSATAPMYFFSVRDAAGLVAAVRQVADALLGVRVRRITISDQVPPNMRPVPDSAAPPGQWDYTTRTMSWSWAWVPAAGVTATWRLEPLETGAQQTNVEATGELEDRDGARRSWTFPVPQVQVLAPRGAPSPTPGPSRTPGATATPKPTSTPVTRSQYFPRALAERH